MNGIEARGTKENRKFRSAANVLLHDLQEIESRAHSLGLQVTAHALNRAKNALGWELAGEVVNAGKAARGETFP